MSLLSPRLKVVNLLPAAFEPSLPPHACQMHHMQSKTASLADLLSGTASASIATLSVKQTDHSHCSCSEHLAHCGAEL